MENILIIFFFSIVLSVWGIVLLRVFAQWLLATRPLNLVNITLPFTLQFLLHLHMFYSTNITTPYLTTLIAILVNVLTLLTWTKAKAFHVLTVATIFSVLILSIDMTLVLGLSLFAKIGPIDYVPIPQISLVANAFVIAPLIYKGLRYVVQLEEERKYLIIRRLLLILTICCMIVSLVVNIFFEYLPSSFWVRGVDLWMFPFVMILFLFSMLAGTEVLHTQHDRKFKELEYQALQQYTRDVEEQSKEIKSFRHDYMNILLSLESYINESSTEELKEFYYKKLVKTAEPMYKEAESELQQLCNIKDKEIKSILTVKIQKMISAGIQVKFEAVEEIKILNIDTVIMVRIIGILLDNAFEEVSSLDIRLVNVGLVKDENDVIFYVSNQCKEEHYDAEEMVKKGYTTKGNGRGTGLSNLANFSSKYKNIFIETKCENHRFTQIVTIGG